MITREAQPSKHHCASAVVYKLPPLTARLCSILIRRGGGFLLVSRSSHSGENRSLPLPSENKITCLKFSFLIFMSKIHFKTHETTHLMTPPPREAAAVPQIVEGRFQPPNVCPRSTHPYLVWGEGGGCFFVSYVPDHEKTAQVLRSTQVKLRTQCHCILRLSIPYVVVAGLDQDLGTAHPGCFVAL